MLLEVGLVSDVQENCRRSDNRTCPREKRGSEGMAMACKEGVPGLTRASCCSLSIVDIWYCCTSGAAACDVFRGRRYDEGCTKPEVSPLFMKT